MRRFGKVLGRLLIGVFLLIGAAFVFAPKEPVDREISFDAKSLPEDLQPWLDGREFQFSNLNPSAAKRIVWAGAAGTKTPLAIVYVHGFSASAEEIRPVPDKVAAALGANLFFTRLAGHGLDGAAMGQVEAGDWLEDMAEAMAIGRRLGDRVVVIATSTGGTLAALAAADPDLQAGLAGVVFVSPNFGVANPAAMLLDLPFARQWAPLLVGETLSFTPKNDAQAKHWTTSYPTVSLLPMQALVAEARAQDYARVTIPALVLYAEADQVVSAQKTRDTLANWAGPLRWEERQMGPLDDAYAHVIAGAILSPTQTDATVALILNWFEGL